MVEGFFGTLEPGGGIAILIKKYIRRHLLPLSNTELIENIGIQISNSTDDYTDIISR